MLIKIKKFVLILVAASSVTANATEATSHNVARSGGYTPELGLNSSRHIYEIQPGSSSLKFRVDSSFGDVWGSFQEFKGNFAMLNSGEQVKTAAIKINAESLDTSAGFVRAMLKSESFFDVEKFPTIHFSGDSIEWYSDTKAILKGEMTIQKKTLPVAFYVELVDGCAECSDRVTIKASTTIKRSEFGLYSFLPIVSDKVNIFMSVNALRKDADVSISSADASLYEFFN